VCWVLDELTKFFVRNLRQQQQLRETTRSIMQAQVSSSTNSPASPRNDDVNPDLASIDHNRQDFSHDITPGKLAVDVTNEATKVASGRIQFGGSNPGGSGDGLGGFQMEPATHTGGPLDLFNTPILDESLLEGYFSEVRPLTPLTYVYLFNRFDQCLSIHQFHPSFSFQDSGNHTVFVNKRNPATLCMYGRQHWIMSKRVKVKSIFFTYYLLYYRWTSIIADSSAKRKF